MIRFNCDYSEGAHPRILERLIETNMIQNPGYGEDFYCEKAADLIRRDCRLPEADVHFLVGGTQVNLVVLAAALRPHQGVVCADSGHINVHESGAIEATGHKVLALPNTDGKITAAQVRACYDAHYNDETHEHMVQPALVYLSQPTESGSLYSKAEMDAIHQVCLDTGLLLYVDGARMGYGLMAENNDLDLPALARMCDAFYIGGTKVGALFGEALILNNPALQKDFRYILKQRVGRLAKGWLLGLQFIALFEDGLYYKLGKHADEMAYRMRDGFRKKGYPFFSNSSTNQQFPILPNEDLKKLSEKYAYSVWAPVDEDHTAVRFCTSWATKEEDVDTFLKDLETL